MDVFEEAIRGKTIITRVAKNDVGLGVDMKSPDLLQSRGNAILDISDSYLARLAGAFVVEVPISDKFRPVAHRVLDFATRNM